MARVIWTHRALKDLVSIRNRIARDNPQAAKAFVESLRGETDRLVLFPESGLIVRETTRRTYRVLVYHGYVTLYYYENDACHVLRVVHGRQNVKWRR